MTRRLRLLALLFVPVSILLPADETAVTYPEHGKIVSETVKRIYRRPPDPTFHGVYHVSIAAYRIETADRIYELKGPPVGSPIGDEIQFRIEKEHAYVLV